MRNPARLSRLSFIGGSAAFLAACSARGASLPGVPAVRDPSRDIPSAGRAVTELGHDGFQISSSKSGHAVAIHTSSGQFVWSLAIGDAFTRHTYEDGRQLVLSRTPPRKKGWYHFEGGGTFRYKRSKAGNVGICAVAGDRTFKAFLYSVDEDTIVVKYQGKVVQKVTLRAPAVPPGATAREKFNSLVDNHGIWSGDDDFIGGAGETRSGRRVCPETKNAAEAQVSTRSSCNVGRFRI